MQQVLLFSGGRTSGLMLRRLLDENPEARASFIFAFCNTGKERDETLDFVHEVETRWDVPVTWLEYHRIPAASLKPGVFPTPRRNQNLAKAAERGETVHWFKQVSYATASRNGEPFDELLNWASVLPNVRARICSVQLKIRSVMRYLFSLGIYHYAPYIGIRKDEEHRKLEVLNSIDAFEHPEFPLIEAGIIEKDVLTYWSASDFDLQLESYEGNCDLCFLKKKSKRVRIVQERPESINWWKAWEAKRALTATGDGRYFRRGEPYIAIEQLALTQPAFESTDVDIPCSCVEKAFLADDSI